MTRDDARDIYRRHADEPRHTDMTTIGLEIALAALAGGLAGGMAWLLIYAYRALAGG